MFLILTQQLSLHPMQQQSRLARVSLMPLPQPLGFWARYQPLTCYTTAPGIKVRAETSFNACSFVCSVVCSSAIFLSFWHVVDNSNAARVLVYIEVCKLPLSLCWISRSPRFTSRGAVDVFGCLRRTTKMADNQRSRSSLKLTSGAYVSWILLCICSILKQTRTDSPVLEYPAYSVAVRLQAERPSEDANNNNNSDSTPAPLRWLDIGTGSGLLASLVAAASSSSPTSAGTPPTPSTSTAESRTTTVEVYACEGVAEVADVAAETFDKNGGSIRLFRGRSTEMEVGRDLPSRVPRVISELLGTGQSVERFCFLVPHSLASLFFFA